jgi:hypothetical protein
LLSDLSRIRRGHLRNRADQGKRGCCRCGHVITMNVFPSRLPRNCCPRTSRQAISNSGWLPRPLRPFVGRSWGTGIGPAGEIQTFSPLHVFQLSCLSCCLLKAAKQDDVSSNCPAVV